MDAMKRLLSPQAGMEKWWLPPLPGSMMDAKNRLFPPHTGMEEWWLSPLLGSVLDAKNRLLSPHAGMEEWKLQPLPGLMDAKNRLFAPHAGMEEWWLPPLLGSMDDKTGYFRTREWKNDGCRLCLAPWMTKPVISARGNGRMMADGTGGEMFHISCSDLDANFLQLKTLLSPQRRQNNFSHDVTGQDLQN
jgi:hypothetical protein